MLDQMSICKDYGCTGNERMESSHLGLSGSNSIEWDKYICGLKRGGIKLSDEVDKISWTHNTKTRDITTKATYFAQCHEHQLGTSWWQTVV